MILPPLMLKQSRKDSNANAKTRPSVVKIFHLYSSLLNTTVFASPTPFHHVLRFAHLPFSLFSSRLAGLLLTQMWAARLIQAEVENNRQKWTTPNRRTPKHTRTFSDCPGLIGTGMCQLETSMGIYVWAMMIFLDLLIKIKGYFFGRGEWRLIIVNDGDSQLFGPVWK